MSPKADAYRIVTDRIIEALEAGVVPWRKPWRNVRGQGPTSMQTGREYRGVNVWILSVTAHLRGYTSPYWATFKQAQERAVEAAIKDGREIVKKTNKRGGTYYVEIIDGETVAFRGGVRKGETGTQVVLWKPVRKTAENENGETEDRSYLILRYFTVFNLEQCDGIEAPVEEPLPERDPIARAEEIVTGYIGGPEIRHGGNRAYYSPALDYIQMPQRGQFSTSEHYYGTLFHEQAHSTGHESRLNRDSLISPTPFGSEDYSKEELVAEMTAALLCGEAGIEINVEHHAGYIASWLRELQNDRKLVVQAAARAQKAADLVLGIQPHKQEEEPTNGSSRSVTQRRRNHEDPHAHRRAEPGERQLLPHRSALGQGLDPGRVRLVRSGPRCLPGARRCRVARGHQVPRRPVSR
jgi:antirestriction protein ArdC